MGRTGVQAAATSPAQHLPLISFPPLWDVGVMVLAWYTENCEEQVHCHQMAAPRLWVLTLLDVAKDP